MKGRCRTRRKTGRNEAGGHPKEITAFTIEKRMPGMFVAREWVAAGGLMSYGENLAEMYRRGAYFVDKILKGANRLTYRSNRSLSSN